MSLLTDSLIGAGVRYQHHSFGVDRTIQVYSIFFDRRTDSCELVVLKGGASASGLESLQGMCLRSESDGIPSIIGAINGNFWSAYKNLPIGPAISNSVVIQPDSYKAWQVCYIDSTSEIRFGTGAVNVSCVARDGSIKINAVNRRDDSTQCVLYTSMFAESVPHVSEKSIEQQLGDQLSDLHTDSLFLEQDSSEQVKSIALLHQQLLLQQSQKNFEFQAVKLLMTSIVKPSINKGFDCVVVRADSGIVTLGQNQFVLSLGKGYPAKPPSVGDTLHLIFSVPSLEHVPITQAVCGVPRLVRNGIAKEESAEMGIKSKRFIRASLPRTAIAIDSSGNVVGMVVVKPTEATHVGASLQQFAVILRRLGYWDALNLDGGGSSCLLVGDCCPYFSNRERQTRRISVGICIRRKNLRIQTEN